MAIRLSETGTTMAIDGNAPSSSGVRMWWLGQAGFLFRSEEGGVLIDPYLSDSLAEKYAGSLFPHNRLMDVPVAPADLRGITHVLLTHAHTDHLDSLTLSAVAKANPRAAFVVPRSAAATALKRGVPPDRMITANAGENHRERELAIHAVPAAHETLKMDEAGNHLFLGYVFTLGGVTFYHSGDTVPFDDQKELLRDLSVDVALLPINGRDAHRSEHGVVGNLTVDEAWEIASGIGASFLVCHHWGMFDFNTADPAEARERLAELEQAWGPGSGGGNAGVETAPRAILPEPAACYTWVS